MSTSLIKELEMQCWEYCDGQNVFNVEKFARLMVQECSDINSCLIGYTDMTNIDNAYTESFGFKVGEDCNG